MDSPAMMLKGHTIYLTPTVIEDLDNSLWYHWYNDPEVTRLNSHGVYPVTPERERTIVQGNLNRGDMILFTVRSVAESKIIGNVALQGIDLLHRKAEIALTIGDPEFIGRTAGIEAAGLIIQHGFERLNLHRIYGGAHAGLKNWLTMLQTFGFEIEGVQKESFFRNGTAHDIICVAVLASTFFQVKHERGASILCDTLSKFMKSIATRHPAARSV
jgi:RimJ/RimL family protein N-acetyltransferase